MGQPAQVKRFPKRPIEAHLSFSWAEMGYSKRQNCTAGLEQHPRIILGSDLDVAWENCTQCDSEEHFQQGMAGPGLMRKTSWSNGDQVSVT